MLTTTTKFVRAAFENDPSISPIQRRELLARLLSPPKAEPATPRPPRILRRKAAAERLTLCLRSVDKLAEDGILTKVVFPGRERAAGILEADVDALIAGKAEEGVQPTKPPVPSATGEPQK